MNQSTIMRIAITILLIILNQVIVAKANNTQDLLNRIQIGYTTRWDIDSSFNYTGKYVSNESFDFDNSTQFFQNSFTQNAIKFDSLGIVFLCAEDGELISSILFRNNYLGNFNFDSNITIGKTSLKSILKYINLDRVYTYKASSFWSFDYKDFTFFFKKNKNHIDSLPIFSKCFNEYLNNPIDYAFLRFPDSLFNQPIYGIGGYLYNKPLYSPKNETHKNCIKLGWPNSLPFFLFPIYAVTGGAKNEKNKEGYWKEYAPNHKLRSEGNYTDNMKNGVFKYYDYNGNYIGSERHFTFLRYWKWILFLCFVGLIFYLKRYRKRIKKENETE